jgi:hypothetical protein
MREISDDIAYQLSKKDGKEVRRPTVCRERIAAEAASVGADHAWPACA